MASTRRSTPRNTLVAAVAISTFLLGRQTQPELEKRVKALETRVSELQSEVVARDDLMVQAAATLVDNMQLAYGDIAREPQKVDSAGLCRQVAKVLETGSAFARLMKLNVLNMRIAIASKNYRAAVSLKSDFRHRIRILEETLAGIANDPNAGARRQQLREEIAELKGLRARIPDPELVRKYLEARNEKGPTKEQAMTSTGAAADPPRCGIVSRSAGSPCP